MTNLLEYLFSYRLILYLTFACWCNFVRTQYVHQFVHFIFKYIYTSLCDFGQKQDSLTYLFAQRFCKLKLSCTYSKALNIASRSSSSTDTPQPRLLTWFEIMIHSQNVACNIAVVLITITIIFCNFAFQ